jgi:hypothetical protein
MINTIQFNNSMYPAFQEHGNAAQFAIPFAKHVCFGEGYDIGCNREEWSFPGSIPIDPILSNEYDAENLPEGEVDYIFSSHCLEHIPGDWYGILQYWKSKIKEGGTMFLYLPDYTQEYWRPWNNRKHVHVFNPQIMVGAFGALGFTKWFVSGADLNNSFIAMGQV